MSQAVLSVQHRDRRTDPRPLAMADSTDAMRPSGESSERMSAQIETTLPANADSGADSVSNFERVSRIEIPCYFDFPIPYLTF